MATGYIKLFKSIQQLPFYQDVNTLHLYIHLLLNANYKDSLINGIEIKRGQLLTSFRKLSKESGLSEQTIRTCLSKLKVTQQITQQSTHHFSIITLVKYSDYQDSTTEGNTATNTQSNNIIEYKEIIKNSGGKSAKKTKSKSVQNSENDSYQDLFNAEQSGSLEFAEIWLLWVEYLKERGKPLLKSTAKIHLNKLSKYPVSVQLKMIEKSIERKWQSLFPLNDADMKAIATEIKQDELSFNPDEWTIYEAN